MEMSGEYKIPAPREEVWTALNDPEVLKQAIPGAESVEKVSDTEFAAVARAKIGPVNAKFKGTVTLSDLDPPNGYTINGEGSGGAAGFAKGSAKVRLDQDGDHTRLLYEVHATVGGKLAQIGQRLVNSSASKMADEFFTNFSTLAGGEKVTPEALPGAHPETDAIAPTDAPMLPDEEAAGLSPWMWATIVILGVAVLVYLLST